MSVTAAPDATMMGTFPSRSFTLVCAAPARFISRRTPSANPASAAQCSAICFFLFGKIGFAPPSSKASMASIEHLPAAR
eukprot:CAMPEP_0184482194 /NCGR_PEP_ID=MMETSP0113_2-20130426/3770_1 /TAXON_ID=91329 /ORGANISM="Norrisiella sphaerica, Strain BC52" /LENGTH=78 /DNA_ID=CAMNT_0026861793 /DNA_START=367 /DNA_END=603 /DNA_ORIENTATION=+